jgi:hypothetical protein
VIETVPAGILAFVVGFLYELDRRIGRVRRLVRKDPFRSWGTPILLDRGGRERGGRVQS